MISNLRLINFKCFADQQLPLRPLTVLSGINGTGKSSVLQALLLLRQSHEQKILPDRGLALNGNLAALGTGADALRRTSETDETIGFEVEFENRNSVKWLFAYDANATVLPLKESPYWSDVFSSSLFGDGFQYLSAERLGPRTSFAMADYLVRQQRQLGSRGEFTAHFLSVFGRETISLKAALRSEASSESLLHQVESWLGTVSPGVRLEITEHPSMDVIRVQYAFVEGRLVSDPFRPTNVGFGLTYTLPIIVATLASRPDGLRLFENPEAHLHAKGQVKLAELAARAAADGVQIELRTSVSDGRHS